MITIDFRRKLRWMIFGFSLSAALLISEANAHIITVSVNDYSFSPPITSAITGDTVRWMLASSGIHTTTCGVNVPGTLLPTGANSWDAILNESDPVFEYVLSVPGTYKYVCLYNTPFMNGTINVGSSLPVELSEFVATTIKNEVILDWSTVGEFNNDKFEIQRISISGTPDFGKNDLLFTTIGSLKGNGTSGEAHNYRYHDRNLRSGTYMYRLKQVDYNSNYVYFLLNNEVNIGVPGKFYVSQNYPNPFNPETRINFQIPEAGYVSIIVYDFSGREVGRLFDGNIEAGYQSIDFNGATLPSGAYFCKVNYLRNGNLISATKMMMLVK